MRKNTKNAFRIPPLHSQDVGTTLKSVGQVATQAIFDQRHNVVAFPDTRLVCISGERTNGRAVHNTPGSMEPPQLAVVHRQR